MNQMPILLASVVVHLAEFLDSDNTLDLEAARGILSNQLVRDELARMRKGCMLPLPRKTLTALPEAYPPIPSSENKLMKKRRR